MSSRILVITSQFNELITHSLEKGALETLKRAGYEGRIDQLSAPGAYELPLLAKKAAESGKWEGIVCLGCVIKGETPHFDFVCAQAASGLMRVSLDNNIPVSFGVLTTNTIEQAFSRAGLKSGNKGCEATQAVLDTLTSLGEIERG